MNELFSSMDLSAENIVLQFLCNFSTIIMFFVFTRAITEERFSRPVTILVSGASYTVIFLLTIFLLPSGDAGLSLENIILTAFLPTVILLHITSKGSFFQIVTMWSIGIIFFYIITLSGLYVRLANHSVLPDLLVRILIFAPVLFLVIRFARKPALEFTHSIKKYWSFIWLLPFSIACLLTYLIYSPINILQYPGNIPPAVVLLAISVFSIAILYLVFQETQVSTRHRKDSELLQSQISAQKRQFELQEENIRLTKMYRHDMRHHINVISGFLQNNATQQALDYVLKTQAAIENTVLKTYCSQSAANSVLSSYCAAAEQKGISVQVHAEIPNGLGINEMELCSVLANCIENAIHACEALDPSAGWIDILIRRKERQLAIQIRNPYSATIVIGEDGLPVSAHPEGGIGMKSVALIAQKYNGLIHISTEKNIYCIRIVLYETAD